MKLFVTSTPALPPKSQAVKKIAILFAVILTVMAVAQLYTFEAFMEVVALFGLPVSDGIASALPPILIATEVFALPFLLRMSLSPAFRWFSMLCGWFVAATWFFISAWVVSTNQSVSTIGYLGDLVQLVPGWWAVCLSFALIILATWCAWGLWPGRRR